MIELKVMVFTIMLMGHSTKVSGWKINKLNFELFCRMVEERKLGLMEQSILDLMSWERRKVMVSFLGVTEQHMMENFRTIIFKV